LNPRPWDYDSVRQSCFSTAYLPLVASMSQASIPLRYNEEEKVQSKHVRS
jgi:hypothetical protein